MPAQWDRQQFEDFVTERYEDDAPEVLALVGRWLERGDGAAIYMNAELGHPQFGMPRITSFGSSDSQLEPECETCRIKLRLENGEWAHDDAGMSGGQGHVPVYPPQRLPDIGNQINWRFQLVATYRGASKDAPPD